MGGAVVFKEMGIIIKKTAVFLKLHIRKLLYGSVISFLFAAFCFFICLFVRTQPAADLFNILILAFLGLGALLSGLACLIILKDEAGSGL